LLGLLDDQTRRDVSALLAYAEDERAADEPALRARRSDVSRRRGDQVPAQAGREVLENVYYVYVIGRRQKLVGVVSFRDLFGAAPELTVARADGPPDLITRARRWIRRSSRSSSPITTCRRSRSWTRGRMKGIVTVETSST